MKSSEIHLNNLFITI